MSTTLRGRPTVLEYTNGLREGWIFAVSVLGAGGDYSQIDVWRGAVAVTSQQVAAGNSQQFGPFNRDVQYRVRAFGGGSLAVTISDPVEHITSVGLADSG